MHINSSHRGGFGGSRISSISKSASRHNQHRNRTQRGIRAERGSSSRNKRTDFKHRLDRSREGRVKDSYGPSKEQLKRAEINDKVQTLLADLRKTSGNDVSDSKVVELKAQVQDVSSLIASSDLGSAALTNSLTSLINKVDGQVDALNNTATDAVATTSADLASRLNAVESTAEDASTALGAISEGAFQEQNGQVVIEAENFHTQTAGSVGQEFTVEQVDGRSVISTTDTGANAWNTTNGAQLDYAIDFETAGTYYVWISQGANGGGSNSVHAGLDGEAVTTNANKWGLGTSGSNDWEYSNRLIQYNTDSQSTKRVTINVTEAGVHDLNLWMREDGTQIDRIVLTQDADFTPTDDLAESSRTQASELNLQGQFDQIAADLDGVTANTSNLEELASGTLNRLDNILADIDRMGTDDAQYATAQSLRADVQSARDSLAPYIAQQTTDVVKDDKLDDIEKDLEAIEKSIVNVDNAKLGKSISSKVDQLVERLAATSSRGSMLMNNLSRGYASGAEGDFQDLISDNAIKIDVSSLMNNLFDKDGADVGLQKAVDAAKQSKSSPIAGGGASAEEAKQQAEGADSETEQAAEVMAKKLKDTYRQPEVKKEKSLKMKVVEFSPAVSVGKPAKADKTVAEAAVIDTSEQAPDQTAQDPFASLMEAFGSIISDVMQLTSSGAALTEETLTDVKDSVSKLKSAVSSSGLDDKTIKKMEKSADKVIKDVDKGLKDIDKGPGKAKKGSKKSGKGFGKGLDKSLEKLAKSMTGIDFAAAVTATINKAVKL